METYKSDLGRQIFLIIPSAWLKIPDINKHTHSPRMIPEMFGIFFLMENIKREEIKEMDCAYGLCTLFCKLLSYFPITWENN